MHEDYIDKRPHHVPSTPVTARIPEEWKGHLEIIAMTEGDNMNGILQEGVMRVIEARKADPNYPTKMAEAMEAQRQRIATRLRLVNRAIIDFDTES